MAALRRIACLLDGGPVSGPAPESERALLEVALAHSPRVEMGGQGVVYLDVAGLGGLWGDETEIAGRLVCAAGGRGLQIRVGIAGSRIGALVAARRGSGVAVIGPGEDAETLARAPLSLLDLTDEMRARLGRWGLRTLGDLSALPATALFERLGSEGLRLQRLARGEDPRPFRPWTPPPAFEESAEPGWAMETLEPVADLLASLAERIAGKLERRGLSADRLEWTCRLAGGAAHEGSSAPIAPTHEAAVITALLRTALESHPPRGAVEAVTLRAHPTRAAPAQESLTDPARPSPMRLAAILARLAVLVGARQVGVPVLLDSHRPDAVTLDASSQAPGRGPGEERGEGRGEGRGEDGDARAALGLRRLRPPRPASVTVTGGRPVHLRSDRLSAAIVASAGPWRSSGEWWTAGPWARDEWDVETSDGTLCRLVHDGSAWWLEGVYD